MMSPRAATDGGPCVLIVDDAPDTRRFVRAVLEKAEYEVWLAPDGESALDRLSWITPDAILLDACLPGLSGFETCRRIKADAGLAQIPIIFMTGLVETEHVVEAFAAGGIDYVTKPVCEPELLARLGAHWRNGRLTRLARAAVDIAGRGVVLLDDEGVIGWCSPRARQWLAILGSDGVTWPAGSSGRSPSPPAEPDQPGIFELGHGQQLHVRHLGAVGRGESMLMLEERPAGLEDRPPGQGPGAQVAALTRREAEVLSWLAKGKTNRDIAEILGISRHTVSKHLEHLFEKLGVETRSAATAIATRQGLAASASSEPGVSRPGPAPKSNPA